MNTKGKAAETKIYSVFDKLDPSGLNTKKYKELFSKMSDSEFINYFKQMKNDETKNF